MDRSPKSKRVDVLLCAFLGVTGAHRFYEGKTATGVLYLVSLGGLGIGAIADLLQLAFGVRTDKQGRSIGSPSRLPVPLMRGVSIALAVALVAGTGGILLERAINGPVVADDYYDGVDTARPIEAEYTQLGPYSIDEATFESHDSHFEKFKIWFPADMSQEGARKFPAVVVANGSGTPFFRFEPILRHLASWGFIVIGNDDPDSGDGRSTSMSLDFLLSLDRDTSSVFFAKVDATNIGAAGHSQGGPAVINAATRYDNSDDISSVFVASTTSRALIEKAELTSWAYDPSSLGVPYFAVAGTGEADAELIAPLHSLVENFELISDGLPAVIARRDGADHGDMLSWADGYMTAWFRYTLADDGRAKDAFVGQSAEIERNPNWIDIHRKGLE